MAAAYDTSLRIGIYRYLRRTYANNLTGLRQLAEKYFAESTESVVTLTSLASEGGSQAGQITCPRGLLLEIVEQLITELDTSAPRGSQAAVFLSR